MGVFMALQTAGCNTRRHFYRVKDGGSIKYGWRKNRLGFQQSGEGPCYFDTKTRPRDLLLVVSMVAIACRRMLILTHAGGIFVLGYIEYQHAAGLRVIGRQRRPVPSPDLAFALGQEECRR